MTEPTRWVIIDDRDPRIRYLGTWTTPNGDRYNNQGNFGQTYSNTLHSSDKDGSSFSFTFTGNAARIMGTNDLKINADGSVADPDWDCLLDGNVVSKESYFQYTENNWVFCSFPNLVAKQYTIGLKVKTKGRSFWFDQIQYRPTGTVRNEVVAATRDDADLTYSSGWSPLANVAHNTLLRGSTATFRFIGTGVSLWAMYPHELPHNAGEATYILDGGSPVTFTIPGGGDTSIYNRRIFGLSGLNNLAHTLEMTYQSGSGNTPLVVGQILILGTNLRATVGGGSSSALTSTSPPVKPPSTAVSSPDIIPPAEIRTTIATALSSATIFLPEPLSTGSRINVDGRATSAGNSTSIGIGGQIGSSETSTAPQVPIGAIVGGILGALAIIVFLLWLIWYRRRRRARLQSNTQDLNNSVRSQRGLSTARDLRGGDPFAPSGAEAAQPMLPHPTARKKLGPAFDSPYISNHDPYGTIGPNMTLGPSGYILSPPSHGQNSGSISYTVETSSHYTDSSNMPSTTGSGHVFHQDSGIRLPIPRPGQVVEHPPVYTLG